MAERESSGEVNLSVDGSQGVQVGSGNVQYNNWAAKQPLDPVALGALNPHVAVARLQRVSHDELVDFFARAKPGDVSEILRVLLRADDRRLLATLGDINRRKVTELFKAIGIPVSRQALPEAAEAIAREAALLRWTHPEPLSFPNGGYARKYKNGHVFWTRGHGVVTTAGVIDKYFMTMSPFLECAISGQETAASSPYGTQGIRQDFSLGTVYSSKHGTVLVIDHGCYEREGGSGGWLGFPCNATEPCRGFTRQRFEGGIICQSTHGIFPVRSAIVKGAVDVDNDLFPVDYEVDAAPSPQGTTGHLQRFDDEDHRPLVIYLSERYGLHVIQGRVILAHDRLGGTGGWLGFPIGGAIPDRSDIDRGWAQEFEGGTVFELDSACFAVSREVIDFLEEAEVDQHLGWPTTEESSAGTGDGDRIQFFENGVVTCRDGKYEVWVRPAIDLAPSHNERAPLAAPVADYGPSRPEPFIYRAVSRRRIYRASPPRRENGR